MHANNVLTLNVALNHGTRIVTIAIYHIMYPVLGVATKHVISDAAKPVVVCPSISIPLSLLLSRIHVYTLVTIKVGFFSSKYLTKDLLRRYN